MAATSVMALDKLGVPEERCREAGKAGKYRRVRVPQQTVMLPQNGQTAS